MHEPTLSLIVFRCADLARSLAFYEAIGLCFKEEKHGAGPIHYSTHIGSAVLELFPASGTGGPRDARSPGGIMVGLRVASLEETLRAIEHFGTQIKPPAKTTPWGARAVIVDPDGRTVELSEPPTTAGGEG
jgi:lactoylglutathione lyase